MATHWLKIATLGNYLWRPEKKEVCHVTPQQSSGTFKIGRNRGNIFIFFSVQEMSDLSDENNIILQNIPSSDKFIYHELDRR